MEKNNGTAHQWISHFPELAPLEKTDHGKYLSAAQIVHFPKGARLYENGAACDRYLLILEGSIRVQRVTSGGHEIVLYHVGPGQACELTSACIIGGCTYPAEAIAETPVRLVSISRVNFDVLVADSPAFREFVYRHVERGITELVSLVEEVAFGHMDGRLAQCLLRQADATIVTKTHQELAAELGSVREVVSRLLKRFERQNWVRLHRGRVDLVDINALNDIAQKTFM